MIRAAMTVVGKVRVVVVVFDTVRFCIIVFGAGSSDIFVASNPTMGSIKSMFVSFLSLLGLSTLSGTCQCLSSLASRGSTSF